MANGEKVIKSFNLDTSDIKAAGEVRTFDIFGDNSAVFSLEVVSPEIIFTDATCDYNNDPTIAHDDDNGRIEVGMLVSGTGIPVGATVSSVTSDTSFELSASTTGGSVTNGTLTFTRGKKYYNFQTNLFQTTETKLSNITIGTGSYTGNIAFPKVTVGAQYDIFLFSETNHDTRHANYVEVRANDGSIDINSSTGSNSNLVQKVIYQTLDVTITLGSFSFNSAVTGTIGTQTITASRNRSVAKTPFTLTNTVTSTRTLTINKQPTDSDIMTFFEATVGAAGINIPGEDIYPAVTAANKVVNGAVTSGTVVTMDDDFTGLWAVGDKITGNAALDARTQATAVTVASINPSNAKQFSMSEAIAIDDDETLSFSNRRNYRWPISSTTKDLSKITAGIQVFPGEFFASRPQVAEYLTQTTVLEGEAGEYKVDGVRIPALDTLGQKPISVRDETTKVVTTTVGSATNPINIVFSQQALASFSSAVSLSDAKMFAYGTSKIKSLTGYDVEFSDLAITLTKVKTTTTAAVNSSTSVPIANRDGIMDGISRISGIGVDTAIVGTDTVNGAVTSGVRVVMDANVANTMSVGDRITGNTALNNATVTVAALNPDGDNVKEFSMSEAIALGDDLALNFSNQKNIGPKVVSGAGSVTGAGTIVLSAAQTLENGIELTFPGASTIATITGNIKVNKVGNESVSIRFDLEKLLTMH